MREEGETPSGSGRAGRKLGIGKGEEGFKAELKSSLGELTCAMACGRLSGDTVENKIYSDLPSWSL
jgi:hypothetical protein